jgi:CBS domain-containing protein
MIRPLRVRDFMTTALHTVTPDTEIMDAVQKLVEKNISGLLVLERDGRLAGILTERDCIRVALSAGYFDEGGGRVRDFMTKDVQTFDADTSLMDLADTFARERFRRFPVMDDGQLVGVIARRDVLKALTSGTWFSAPAPSERTYR